jgi:hypothetical protein
VQSNRGDPIAGGVPSFVTTRVPLAFREVPDDQ